MPGLDDTITAGLTLGQKLAVMFTTLSPIFIDRAKIRDEAVKQAVLIHDLNRAFRQIKGHVAHPNAAYVQSFVTAVMPDLTQAQQQSMVTMLTQRFNIN